MIKMNEQVLLSQSKFLHKGMMMGHISNGGGEVPLQDGYALKIVANENYVQFNLIHYGIGKEVPHQTWQKVKKVDVQKQSKLNFEGNKGEEVFG